MPNKIRSTRFLVFTYDVYHPLGGLQDLTHFADNADELVSCGILDSPRECREVFDTVTGDNIVIEDRDNARDTQRLREWVAECLAIAPTLNRDQADCS